VKAVLWFVYDLKFDKNKGDDDKIFIDNDITIAVEKNLFIFREPFSNFQAD
jgi:hypothetical protein